MNKNGVFICDANGIRELFPLPKRIPIGAWAKSWDGYRQFQLLRNQNYKRCEWVTVPVGRLPKLLRTHLLLLGLS